VELAVDAGLACLDKAERTPDCIDILINAGIYADSFIAEPATAAFIQRRLGANAEPAAQCKGRTFSFDISNGGCGFLTAVRVVDGFLSAGRIRRGMIVTSDVDASYDASQGFPFEPAGAALLLCGGGPDEGFVLHHTRSFPDYVEALRTRAVTLPGVPTGRSSRRGTYVLSIEEKPEFSGAAVDCAEKVVSALMDEAGLSAVDLVIPSQYPPGFAGALSRRFGWSPTQVAAAPSAPLHTTGLGAALNQAMVDGRFESAGNVILVAVGSGITASAALYHRG
jgi:3-oxoacyl-[acyl-carrier-protein] synthase-3